MQGCLAAGYPFVFGFTRLRELRERSGRRRPAWCRCPSRSEQLLGGHAVLAVGYDDAQPALHRAQLVGTGWGMEGYCTLPYAYLTSASLASDFWTIRAV